MRVPFSDVSYDLTTQIAVNDVLKSGWASKGVVCDEFQAALEKYLGVHVCLVNSGSAALMVALLANEVKAGDTVLVPDFTFVATASVPAILGCKIVPVDCDPETFNMLTDADDDYVEVSEIFTDVAGLPDNVGFWDGTTIIEDGAEALGSEVEGKKIGSFNHLTTFSFQATKQLSTVEGGAITSKDEELIEKCRRIADYGRTKERYVHDILGMNFRMTDIQAAIGLVGLEDLDDNLKRRAKIAERYQKEIPHYRFQKIPSYVTRHAHWAVIGIPLGEPADEMRGRALSKFQKAGIDARAPWRPIHLQPCFDIKTGYPNAVDVWQRGIMFPIWNTMSDEQIDYVVKVANS